MISIISGIPKAYMPIISPFLLETLTSISSDFLIYIPICIRISLKSIINGFIV